MEENKKKRTRTPKPKVKGNGVVVVDDQFVCTYTGDKVAKGLILPQTTGCVFRDLPSAFSYARDQLPPEEAAQLAETWCEKLKQVREQVPYAPPRTQLVQFDGLFTYEQAFPNAELWKSLTEKHGVDVATWKESKKRKPKAAKKDTVTLSKGLYVITTGKGIGGIKRVPGEGEDDEVKKTVKLDKAMTAASDFRKKEAGHTHAYFETDKFHGFGSTTDDANDQHYNAMASRIAQQTLTGPVTVYMRRATKFDL